MSNSYVGKVIAERFEISSQVGEGGMGIVYFAEDLATKGKAAVKFLHRHLIDHEDFVARFRQEAKSASQFRHENAVRILDSGDDDEGTPYIAMDFCPGRSLRSLIDEEAPIKYPRATRIAEQILRALAAAHRSGIIHRDLKPDNIKVESEGSEETVKVLDFGVAKFVGTEDMQEMSGAVKTATGVVFGTPKYMAPEQIRGEEVDSRADLYAVGAILYEMLTGKPTFEAEDMMEFVTKFLHEPVKPLHARVPDLDVPASLERLVMGLVEKERGERPSRAEEVAETLTGFASEKALQEKEGTGKPGFRLSHLMLLGAAALGFAGALLATLLPDGFWVLSELNFGGFCRTFPAVPVCALVAVALGIGSMIAFLLFPRVGEVAFLLRSAVVCLLLAVAGAVSWFVVGSELEGIPRELAAKWTWSFPLGGALVFVLFSLGWGLRRRFLSFVMGGVAGALLAAALLPLATANGIGGIWEISPLELDPIRPALAIAAVGFIFGLCGMLAPRALIQSRS